VACWRHFGAEHDEPVFHLRQCEHLAQFSIDAFDLRCTGVRRRNDAVPFADCVAVEGQFGDRRQIGRRGRTFRAITAIARSFPACT